MILIPGERGRASRQAQNARRKTHGFWTDESPLTTIHLIRIYVF